jgi:hypothetical protein
MMMSAMMVAVPSLRNHVEDGVLQVPVTSRIASPLHLNAHKTRGRPFQDDLSPYLFNIEGN